jgi:hypothetical protein
LNGSSRYTAIGSASDSVHVKLSDDSLFNCPWLFVQQAGRWKIDNASAKRLGEYLRRGGFLRANDIHGPRGLNTFSEAMQRALLECSINEIESNEAITNILYD